MSELFNITHLGKTKLDSMVKTFIWPFDHTKNNEINFSYFSKPHTFSTNWFELHSECPTGGLTLISPNLRS